MMSGHLHRASAKSTTNVSGSEIPTRNDSRPMDTSAVLRLTQVLVMICPGCNHLTFVSSGTVTLTPLPCGHATLSTHIHPVGWRISSERFSQYPKVKSL